MTKTFVRDYFRRKLNSLLAETNDVGLVSAIWNIHNIQSGRGEGSGYFYSLPREFSTKDFASKYFLHSWRLETLINLKLLNATELNKKKPRSVDVRNFQAFCNLYNALHHLEDACDGVALAHKNILLEMYRLTRRQIEWQRGHVNALRLFRYSKIYITPNSKHFFQAKYGIELESFSKFCFAICSIFSAHLSIEPSFDFTQIGIDNQTRDLCFQIICGTVPELQREAAKIRSGFLHVSYAPSVLRSKPCISMGGLIYCPFPELAFIRSMETLFYDFVENDNLRREFGENFESYCAGELADPDGVFQVFREQKYNGEQRATPDLFLTLKGSVKIAFELKSRKLPAIARFGEDPIMQADGPFSEIANGICQLWKYVEDSKSNLVPGEVRANDDTKLMLLTLDEWLGLSDTIDEAVLKLAHEIANQRGIPQAPEIRRRVQFCDADNFEMVNFKYGTAEFLRTVEAASSERYSGWHLASIYEDLVEKGPALPPRADKKGRMGEVLDWWNEAIKYA